MKNLSEYKFLNVDAVQHLRLKKRDIDAMARRGVGEGNARSQISFLKDTIEDPCSNSACTKGEGGTRKMLVFHKADKGLCSCSEECRDVSDAKAEKRRQAAEQQQAQADAERGKKRKKK